MGNEQAFDKSKYKSSFNWENQYNVLSHQSNNVLKLQKKYIQTSSNYNQFKKQPSNQVYYGRELIVINKQQKKQTSRLIELKARNPSPYLTPIEKSAICKTDNYCSSQEKYYLLFQIKGNPLKEDIINRKLNGTLYSQKQAIKIIQNICKGIKYLREIDHSHQNISTQSVFIVDNDNKKNQNFNQVLGILGDPWICSFAHRYHKNSGGSYNYPSYQKLSYRADTIQKYDPYLADLFSLGCLVLQLILEQSIENVYNRGNTSINQYQLECKINEIKNDQLRKMVHILCSRNPSKRQEIYSMFKDAPKRKYLNTSVFSKNGSQVNKQFNIAYSHNTSNHGIQNSRLNNNSSTPINKSVFHQTPLNNTSMVYSINQQRQKQPFYGNSNVSYQNQNNNSYAINQFRQKSKNNLEKHVVSNVCVNSYSQIKSQSSPLNEQKQGQYSKYSIGNFSSQMKNSGINNYMPLTSHNYLNQQNTNFSRLNLNNNLNRIQSSSFSKSLQKQSKINNNNILFTSSNDFNKPSNYNINTVASADYYSLNRQSRSQSLTKINNFPNNSTNLNYNAYRKYDGPLASNYNYNISGFSSNQFNIGNLNKTSQSFNQNLNKSSDKKPFTFNNITQQKNQKQIKIQQYPKLNINLQKKSTTAESQKLETKKEKQFHNPFIQSTKDKSNIQRFKEIQERISNTIKNFKFSPQNTQNKNTLSQNIKKQDEQPTSDRSHKQRVPNIKIEDDETDQKIKTPKKVTGKKQLNSTIKEATNQSASQDQEYDLYPQQNNADDLIFVIQKYDQGSRYEGQKQYGMRNGKGKFFYKQGSYYDGQWKNNKMEGKGILYYKNGKIAYQGDWVNDQFNGFGKVYNDEQKSLQTPFDYTDFYKLDDYWQFYEGQLLSDARHGKGKVKLANGQIFIGNFFKDKVNGQGKYYTLTGTTINGRWKNNRLVEKLD